MQISLKNIGKVKEATVEIQGITVIAGQNNTGKSTVGKALFSVFNSFYNLKSRIDQTREQMIVNAIRSVLMEENKDISFNQKGLVFTIVKNSAQYLNFENMLPLKKLIKTYVGAHVWVKGDFEVIELQLSDEMLRSIIKNCNEILQVADDEIFKRILQRQLDVEFKTQITNVNSAEPSEINFVVRDSKIEIALADSKVQKLSGIYPLNTQAIYYDNPFVIDDLTAIWQLHFTKTDYPTHSQFIEQCLLKTNITDPVEEVIQETIVDKKIENIMQQLNQIAPGELDVITSRKIVYKMPGTQASLNIDNLSTVLKAFVVIKTLLSKGFIQENGTLILDEPEVHLHPEWQLSFAKIIVLLQKEFGLHILLNTHSPYFLRAIQVYAGECGIADKCNYYLAENQEDVAVIHDVTQEIELIYQKLASPLQTLENLGYAHD